MDGFHYYDMFATKGAEYIITIIFFLMLIPFWFILNGKLAKKTAKAKSSAGWLDWQRIPEGVFHNTNHIWAFLERKGTARIGLDKFLTHIAGSVQINPMVQKGQHVKKGQVIAEMIYDNKKLELRTPISGTIQKQNQAVQQNLQEKEDLYKKGWLMEIKPSSWIKDIQMCYLGGQAREWIMSEKERLKDFLAAATQEYTPSPSMAVLQDGGEPKGGILKELPQDVWDEFQKKFLCEEKSAEN